MYVPARLALFSAAIFLVIGIFLPFWPLWLTGRGLGPVEIGIVLAAGPWIRIVVTPVFAHVADRFGARWGVMLGAAAGALLCFLAFVFTHGFWAILALSLAAGVFFAPIIPLGENVTLLLSVRRRFSYARVRLWGSLAFILGAVGGGWLLDGRSSELVLWMLIAAWGLVVAACLAMPRVPVEPDASDAAPRAPLRRIGTNRAFLTVLGAAGLIQAGHAAYYGFGTLHWRAAGIDETVIGALWAEGVIAEVLLFWFAGGLAARIGPARALFFAGLAGVARWAITAATVALPALAAAQALHALTFGLAHLAVMAFIARAVPDSISATAQSLYSGMVMGLAMAIAMPLSGALYQIAPGYAFAAMAGLCAAGAGIALLIPRVWTGGRLAI